MLNQSAMEESEKKVTNINEASLFRGKKKRVLVEKQQTLHQVKNTPVKSSQKMTKKTTPYSQKTQDS